VAVVQGDALSPFADTAEDVHLVIVLDHRVHHLSVVIQTQLIDDLQVAYYQEEAFETQ
jgi:hypothetical protein